MMTTDETGSMGFQPVAYTAFGEPVWRDQGQTHVGWPFPPAGGGSPPAGLGTRYQYAGGWGYESGPWGQDPNDAASPGPLVLYGANPDLPPILLLHAGERWYQPGTGRFIQRDPIGIRGGLNTYRYLDGEPLAGVDPSGLANWGTLEMGAVYHGWRGTGKSVDESVKWTERWSIETGMIETGAALVPFQAARFRAVAGG
jgi:RHS repeat-associated protein